MAIMTIFCSYDADTLGKAPADGRKVKGVIHWVSAENALPAEFRLYDRLFHVANVTHDFMHEVNQASLEIKHGYVEASLKYAKPEEAYQFEREGYFCLDNQNHSPQCLIFNRTVALKDTWLNS